MGKGRDPSWVMLRLHFLAQLEGTACLHHQSCERQHLEGEGVRGSSSGSNDIPATLTSMDMVSCVLLCKGGDNGSPTSEERVMYIQ